MHHLQHIAELAPLLAGEGIRHVVIAPGSRNAPLIQLFTSGGFACHSIVDERSAGYVALGMARELKEPVVVVTTSGTAVMNLGPAATEAYYQELPLIMLTADRPLERIRQFDNQVIDQRAPFYNHTRGFYEFPPELRSREELQSSMEAVHQLVREARGAPGGPVHINLPLLEPLYVKLPEPLLSIPGGGDQRLAGKDAEVPLPLTVERTDSRKILVLAGMGEHGSGTRRRLEDLSGLAQLTVVAENIANLTSPLFVAAPELVLAGADDGEKELLAPHLLVTFGGRVVSKRMKLFIESLSPMETLEIGGDPLRGLEKLADLLSGDGGKGDNTYLALWKGIEKRELSRFSAYLDRADYCNLKAVRTILASIPAGAALHLGNSGTIRYSQLMEPREELSCYANRGTSGIDGCLSSATGAAMVSERLHLLIVGDLSFVYDSNALWNKDFPRNLRIIVLNDGGGGIFRLLEGPDRMEFFEEFSVTHHPVSLELIAQAFGRSFRRASGQGELEQGLEELFQPDGTCSILEVDTSGCENSRIFKQFFSGQQ